LRLLCLDIYGLNLDLVQTKRGWKHVEDAFIVRLFIVSFGNQGVEILENFPERADPTFVFGLEIRLELQSKLFEDRRIVKVLTSISRHD